MTQSDVNKANLSEEDYLRKHIEGLERNKQPQNIGGVERITPVNSLVSDLEYFTFDVSGLPCGVFYPAGTTIQVRPCQTKEIQAYSMVDDNNLHDIIEKMNDMLASCVRVKYLNGDVAPYTHVRDQDRFFLIFLIRELTFQKGNMLNTKATCSCGNEVSIEFKRENFRFYETDEKIMKYYDNVNNCFTFKTKQGDVFSVAPPTIGIQKSFTEWIIKENSQKNKLNMSLLKIIPFMLVGKTSITFDEIKKEEKNYQNMDMMSFQFLNDVVSRLTFGIESLANTCVCGQEVRTPMTFPNGASGIFLISNPFEQFIEE